MKNYIIALIVIVLAGLGIYFFTRNTPSETPTGPNGTATSTSEGTVTEMPEPEETTSVIGKSAEGRDITAYHFGTGEKEVVFVGGIHGGYSWNTSLLAYELVSHFEDNTEAVPDGLTVTVIPVLNPDGLAKVVSHTGPFTAAEVSTSSTLRVAGRFNARKVDLNRNFDCNWKSTGTWQNTPVSGGTTAFSEPESAAMRSYMQTNDPAAVVIWYSAVGGVFSSNCNSTISPETRALTTAYAQASGYPAHETYDFYETTGDFSNWLAKQGTPAISVLLTNHQDTEFSKNRAGVEAVIEQVSK